MEGVQLLAPNWIEGNGGWGVTGTNFNQSYFDLYLEGNTLGGINANGTCCFFRCICISMANAANIYGEGSQIEIVATQCGPESGQNGVVTLSGGGSGNRISVTTSNTAASSHAVFYSGANDDLTVNGFEINNSIMYLVLGGSHNYFNAVVRGTVHFTGTSCQVFYPSGHTWANLGATNLWLKFKGYTPLGFSAGPFSEAPQPALPIGTGSPNAVTNYYPWPVRIYQATGSALGTHIVDGFGNDQALAVDPGEVTLDPGAKIYYSTAVPASWLWYGT